MRTDEQLQKINDAKTQEEKELLLKTYGKMYPLNMILSLNYNDDKKLDLPDGPPTKYKRDEIKHPDLFQPLSSLIRRLKVCQISSEVDKLKKIAYFMDVLEELCPQEQDVLLFAKDKALEELYPNITGSLVGKVFPQYVKKNFIE